MPVRLSSPGALLSAAALTAALLVAPVAGSTAAATASAHPGTAATGGPKVTRTAHAVTVSVPAFVPAT